MNCSTLKLCLCQVIIHWLGSEIDASPGLHGPQRKSTGGRGWVWMLRFEPHVDRHSTLHPPFYSHQTLLQPIVSTTCLSFLQGIAIQSLSSHLTAFIFLSFCFAFFVLLISTPSAALFQTPPCGTAGDLINSWAAEGAMWQDNTQDINLYSTYLKISLKSDSWQKTRPDREVKCILHMFFQHHCVFYNIVLLLFLPFCSTFVSFSISNLPFIATQMNKYV